MNLWWIVTVASLVGLIFNVKKSRMCFAIWIITNVCWMFRTFNLGAYEQTVLYGVYFGSSVCGWIAWKQKGEAA